MIHGDNSMVARFHCRQEDWARDTIPLEDEELSFALGKDGSTRKKLAKASGCILESLAWRLSKVMGIKPQWMEGLLRGKSRNGWFGSPEYIGNRHGPREVTFTGVALYHAASTAIFSVWCYVMICHVYIECTCSCWIFGHIFPTTGEATPASCPGMSAMWPFLLVPCLPEGPGVLNWGQTWTDFIDIFLEANHLLES